MTAVHSTGQKGGIYMAAGKNLVPGSAQMLLLRLLAERDMYGYQMILQSKVRELLTWLLRIWRDDGFDTDCYFSSLTKENTIYTITEYIDRHACENIRVEDIAALCHMSYSHFAKNFREIYGQSCKKYIEFIRLCKVEDMLLFTNFDLNYISQETGYADCSHLIRSFKEKYGVSPHQYRRQHSSPRQNH